MTPAEALTRRRVERLLWRAGFGPRPGDIDRLAKAGLPRAIDELLAPAKGPEVESGGRAPTIDGKPLDPLNTFGHDALWWLDRMVTARHPLVERMTLNLHDHFACSTDEVGDVALMMTHYRTLRTYALGNFRALTHAMTNDGAMQIFLSLANSSKGSPNENYARELFELFTLGVNNGYTEQDIREASRALTGFTYDYDTKKFGWDPEQHDNGTKRIFGKRGNFGPKEVVNLAIDHPNHAPYICGKLWTYFTPRPIDPPTLKRLVAVYRGSKMNLRPVVRTILTHPAIYDSIDSPDQVKPPAVYLAGMLRATGRKVDKGNYFNALIEMGQVPFRPPNVAGWDQNEAWLSTATIQARFHAASGIIDKTLRDGGVPKTETPAKAISSAIRATGRPWHSPRTRAALARYAVKSVAGKTEGDQWEHAFAERQRVLRHVLLAGPDAQVC